MFLDILYRPGFIKKKKRPVYFSKHNVSETGFCLRLQVKPTQLGPVDRATHYLCTIVTTFTPYLLYISILQQNIL
jgi:hypothetical protein